MKVVQINAVYNSGSTGRICKELSLYMNEKNIENYIFFGSGSNAEKNAFRLNSDFDVKIHGLLSRLSGKQAYFSKRHTKKILDKLDTIKPDIVHLHNLHGNFINLNMLLKYLADKDIATVITLHDCWFMTGKCTHYTIDKCCKWQTGCHNCVRLKKDNISWFFDRTSKMWEDKKTLFEAIPRLGVIGVSDWITNETRKSYLKNADVIKRIYNWIDTGVFYPREENIKKKYNIPEDKFTILTVSAGWEKDSVKFNDIMKLAKQIDDSMQIVMIGGGIDLLSLPKGIIGIDYIDGTDELAKVYSCADAYVHVSREDTFGKVVAEAMACGTPAVVYNSTGLPELIENGCGYTVPCGDVDDAYNKLKIIQANTKQQYSKNCVDGVYKRFNKENLMSDTLSVYQKLCDLRVNL